MKKLISLLLALMMVFSMATVAFAAEGQDAGGDSTAEQGTGSIKIENVAVQKQEDGSYKIPSEYKVYKMFDVHYDVDKTSFVYTLTDAWESFLDYKISSETGTVTEAVSQYLKLENGNVVWVAEEGEDPEERASKLATLAKKYADANNVSATSDEFYIVEGTITVDPKTGMDIAIIKVDGLDLGYYLVDSTAGVLCGLTTTKPNASFVAKNVPPSLSKKVKEDDISSGSIWGDTSTSEIGQLIDFDITITVHAGAQDYVVHDTMGKGLKFAGIQEVIHEVSGGTKHEMKVGEDYILNTAPTDGCSFEITFADTFYTEAKSGDRVVILYQSKLTEDALAGNDHKDDKGNEQDINKNDVYLHYGENSVTVHKQTTSKTYAIELAKTKTDGTLLPGAIFRIYRSMDDATRSEVTETGGKVAVTTDTMDAADPTVDDAMWFVNTNTTTTDRGYPIYRVAQKNADGTYEANAVQVLKMDTSAVIHIVGLDTDHYFVKETKEPQGYNKLAAPKDISVEGNHLLRYDENDKPTTGSGFQVVNQSGSVLPETGARGTTMFLIFGSFVVLATGVLLVTKKRMSMIED